MTNNLFAPIRLTVLNCWGEVTDRDATYVRPWSPYSIVVRSGRKEVILPERLCRW